MERSTYKELIDRIEDQSAWLEAQGSEAGKKLLKAMKEELADWEAVFANIETHKPGWEKLFERTQAQCRVLSQLVDRLEDKNYKKVVDNLRQQVNNLLDDQERLDVKRKQTDDEIPGSGGSK